MRRILRQFLPVIFGYLFLVQQSMHDKSVSNISGLGWEFLPADSSLPPLLTCTTKKLLYCNLECNKRIDCRTFDYDETSRQCRLWDADTTTGSIVVSSTKPRSSVGSIKLSPSIYLGIHNQSCEKCAQSRYEICDTDSNTCQCPLKTFWDGSMCSAQLLRNQICARADACRADLNLTCEPSCDLTYRCSTPLPIGIGQTAAGFCNDSVGGGLSGLQKPYGIYVSPITGILYVIDFDAGNVLSFAPFSRFGVIFFVGLSNQLMDIFVDNSETFYITDRLADDGALYIQQENVLRSIPAAGQSVACVLGGLYNAYGLAVDRHGNMYVSMNQCYIVVKWAPNATTGVLVGGQPGVAGITGNRLGRVRFLHLDDLHGILYVCDTGNHRIQKFIIGGNGTAVTVAGTGTAGLGLNQLNGPAGIWVTRDGQTLYVADYNNNRVMKWTIGTSPGSLFAGSLSGLPGTSNQHFNGPGDVALDPTETFLYVSDYENNRVQRFRVR